MAKKKPIRRVPQSPTPRMYGDGKPSQTSQAAPAKSGGASRSTGGTATSASARGAANLASEYGYVVGDLKRLFITAGALFALLVVLKVVIQ